MNDAAATAVTPRIDRGVAAAFAASVFVSAGLLFAVQPLFAKMALPMLGGAPGVWSVALVFFQAALLVGYAYAHALARLSSLPAQLFIHAAILALAALSLPLALSDALGPPTENAPVAWLMGLMALSVGAPFAALSATAPLLQSWYARTRQADAADPYHLYVASNVGSLVSLIAYPLIVEPFTALGVQTSGWSLGFVAAGLAILGCGVIAARQDQGKPAQPVLDAAPAPYARLRERLLWIALAAIPSSLLIGATNHISTDVAAAPFLWAPPLILYLLTFIIAFSKKPAIDWEISSRLYAVLGMGAAALVATIILVPEAAIPLNLAALFFGALVCHHALAMRRPHAARLTEFYLFLSLGGVLGGLFNALAAPHLFDKVSEYPIALVLALAAIAPVGIEKTWRTRAVLLLITAAPIYVVIAGRLATPETGVTPGWVVPTLLGSYVTALIAALGLRDRPLVFAGAGVLMLIGAMNFEAQKTDFRDRSFFGVLRVTTYPDAQIRTLSHGTTTHGSQSLKPGDERRPLTYYAVEGPLGSAIVRKQALTVNGRFAAVGLGAGSLACYARSGETWRFYEIDPMVARVAKDPSRFTYLSNCAPDAPILIGDARLKLAEAERGFYDLIALDAFSSDTVPAHLMTREALAMYMQRLKPDGVLLFHISNRHMNLKDTLARVVAAEGLSMRFADYNPSVTDQLRGVYAADVMMIAQSEEKLEAMTRETGEMWAPVTVKPGRPWTDDYTNILGAIFEKRFGAD